MSGQRRVEPQRDETVAADRLIDELGERALGDDLAVIDDHRARAARFGLLEMMRGQQQRHALAAASSASMS